MALFRVDFSGRGELADRQQKLAQMLSKLQKLSEGTDKIRNLLKSKQTNKHDKHKKTNTYVYSGVSMIKCLVMTTYMTKYMTLNRSKAWFPYDRYIPYAR